MFTGMAYVQLPAIAGTLVGFAVYFLTKSPLLTAVSALASMAFGIWCCYKLLNPQKRLS
jgi:hypothetical protein